MMPADNMMDLKYNKKISTGSDRDIYYPPGNMMNLKPKCKSTGCDLYRNSYNMQPSKMMTINYNKEKSTSINRDIYHMQPGNMMNRWPECKLPGCDRTSYGIPAANIKSHYFQDPAAAPGHIRSNVVRTTDSVGNSNLGYRYLSNDSIEKRA